MSSSVLRHAVHVGFLTLSAAALFACGGDDGEPTDPHDQIDAVHEALSSPTGKVDATSMKTLSASFDSITVASPVLSAVGAAAGADKSCLDGDATSGKVDLSCATSGQITGSLEFEIEVSGGASSGEAFETITFHKACTEGVCVDGTAASQVKLDSGSLSTIFAFSADVSRDGTKKHVFYGSEATLEGSSSTSKLAVFDGAGNSYVWNASIGPDGASWSVEGNNGSFSCSTQAAAEDGSVGASGSCTGSANFDF